jgi:hypothetical protein
VSTVHELPDRADVRRRGVRRAARELRGVPGGLRRVSLKDDRVAAGVAACRDASSLIAATVRIRGAAPA